MKTCITLLLLKENQEKTCIISPRHISICCLLECVKTKVFRQGFRSGLEQNVKCCKPLLPTLMINGFEILC